MSFGGQPMVKIRFEGKCLANCDFFTKSDPYLILSRPITKGAYDFKQVKFVFSLKIFFKRQTLFPGSQN